MAWPFRDFDFYGNRYVTIEDETATLGERMWYERDIDRDTKPTECVLCIEAENERYTHYAHPKAHGEAHTRATTTAERLALKETDTEDYLEYYTFYYKREYIKLYTELYTKYKNEYSVIVLERKYSTTDRICQHHLECMQYHFELK